MGTFMQIVLSHEIKLCMYVRNDDRLDTHTSHRTGYIKTDTKLEIRFFAKQCLHTVLKLFIHCNKLSTEYQKKEQLIKINLQNYIYGYTVQ